MDRIIKDRTGKPQGIVRQMADGREELLSNSGHRVAYYDPNTDATYKPGGYKIVNGSGLTHENRITPQDLSSLLRKI